VIVLVGFMGAGKTTVGRLLSRQLGVPFADVDAVIEENTGTRVQKIFAERGEPAFRALEHETIASLLAGPPLVLALGGGAVEHEQTRRLLSGSVGPGRAGPRGSEGPGGPEEVVYLHVPYAGALDRVGGDHGRPMLRRPDLEQVYQRRLANYQAVATLTMSTAGRTAGQVCADIVARLARTQPDRMQPPAEPPRTQAARNR
jgi:shikimate kinase